MGEFNIILEAELNEVKLISRNVLNYFETFIQGKILAEKKLIIGTKWHHQLMISITDSDFDYIEQPGYRNFSSEKRKLYVAFVPQNLFKNNINEKDIAEIVFECICKFLLNNFKKIDRPYLIKKKELIDWNYLLSIPYPAIEDEVEYMGLPLKEYKAMLSADDNNNMQTSIEYRVSKPPHYVSFPYFNRIDINNLNEFYTVNGRLNGRDIEMNLHCYQQTMSQDKVEMIMKRLSAIQLLDTENRRQIWASVQATEEPYYYLKELVGFFGKNKNAKQETGFTSNSINEQLIQELHFHRIAFFPDVPHSEIVCDYVLGNNLSDEQIAIFKKLDGTLINIDVES